MRILIACNHEPMAQRISDVLARSAMEFSSSYTVSLDLTADRASRLLPNLVILVLDETAATGVDLLREIGESVPKAHVLVVGPATDAKLVLRTLHEGADEYLDQAQLESELTDALLRVNDKITLDQETDTVGRVIGVLAPSGGSGCSTVAANLATILATQHQECGLIDLRLTAGDLAAMLNLKPVHTMAELCDRLARVDRSMLDQVFVRHSSGVHLLAPPSDLADIEKIDAKAVRRLVALARDRFPCVVIDLDNAFSSEQVEAIWQADVLLMVVRLDYVSLRNARRVMDRFATLGIGAERIRLVVNGYGQGRQLRPAQAEEALAMKIAHYLPNDPVRVNRAINHGVPVVLHRPWATISRRLRDLAMSVNGYDSHAPAKR
jgi:pilus assembly protein CpaE